MSTKLYSFESRLHQLALCLGTFSELKFLRCKGITETVPVISMRCIHVEFIQMPVDTEADSSRRPCIKHRSLCVDIDHGRDWLTFHFIRTGGKWQSRNRVGSVDGKLLKGNIRTKKSLVNLIR